MDSIVLKKYGVTKFEYQIVKYKAKRKIHKNSKPKLKKMIISFSAVSIAILFGFGGTILYKNNIALTKNEPVYLESTQINGYEISGLTQNQAFSKIQPELDEQIDKQQITYSLNEKTYQLSFEDLNIENNLSDVLNQIIDNQQSGNIFEKLQKQKDTQTDGAYYSVSLVYDEENIKNILQDIALPLTVMPCEPELIFNADAVTDEDYIQWSESKNGYEVDIDSFADKTIFALQTENYDLGELKLNELVPQNTKSDFENNVVKISEFSTDVLWSKDGRENKLHNMNLLAEKLNGNIIEPGNNWSLNDIAGERNEENGWVLAPAIWSGAMTEEYGGGICQVATTVYNAMLLAEIDIVERHAHSSASSYVDIGMDATVDYGVKDLVVKNSLSDNVYLVVKCDEEAKTVTAMVFGPKPEHDYQVVVRATLSQSNIQPEDEPKYIEASDGFAPDGTYIEPGQTYTYVKPKTGSRYKTYLYYYEQNYNPEEDSPYCWVGYEKGDNYSGEKYEVMFVDKDTGEDIKNIMTYYPPQQGKYYYNPS